MQKNKLKFKTMNGKEARAIELQKEIIQSVWENALIHTEQLIIRRPGKEDFKVVSPQAIKKLDGGKWEMLQQTLKKLPLKLNTTSELDLTEQFESLNLSKEEIDNLELSLWEYFEDYNLEFDLGDDGMDEAEQEKDVISYLIRNILDHSREVLHPTFLGYHYVECWLLDNNTPDMWYSEEQKKEMVELYQDPEVVNYNEAFKLWLQENDIQ